MEILQIKVACVVLVKLQDAVHQFTHQHCTFSVFSGEEGEGILWRWNIFTEKTGFKRGIEWAEE